MDDGRVLFGGDRRDLYASAFKQVSATNGLRVEGKGVNAVQIPALFRRLSAIVNDDAKSLYALPDLHKESLVDKVIVLKARRCETPLVQLPDRDDEDASKRFRETISQELSSYIFWLINEFEVPQELRDRRYGVKAYQHPELAEKLFRMTDESGLLEIIDRLLFTPNPGNPWKGTAQELENRLRELGFAPHIKQKLDKLLAKEWMLTQHLGKLKATGRVMHLRTNSKRYWVILPPGVTQQNLGLEEAA